MYRLSPTRPLQQWSSARQHINLPPRMGAKSGAQPHGAPGVLGMSQHGGGIAQKPVDLRGWWDEKVRRDARYLGHNLFPELAGAYEARLARYADRPELTTPDAALAQVLRTRLADHYEAAARQLVEACVKKYPEFLGSVRAHWRQQHPEVIARLLNKDGIRQTVSPLQLIPAKLGVIRQRTVEAVLVEAIKTAWMGSVEAPGGVREQLDRWVTYRENKGRRVPTENVYLAVYSEDGNSILQTGDRNINLYIPTMLNDSLQKQGVLTNSPLLRKLASVHADMLVQDRIVPPGFRRSNIVPEIRLKPPKQIFGPYDFSRNLAVIHLWCRDIEEELGMRLPTKG